MDEGVSVDLFGNPKPAEVVVEEPSARGLLDDGLVRTTGWLQLGTHAISSEAFCALVFLVHGLVIAIALVSANPVLAGLTVLAAPPCGWALWRLVITRLLPASRTRGASTVEAHKLVSGCWVCVHGSIGPVGRVASTTSGSSGEVTVWFAGGSWRTWPVDHQVHVVELAD
ncbi:hypothetical protein C8D88_12281 [Lentzea atacamensis]|uniref:Uncharacterized protein n=1 Tax=Lentzea atacamensis TaxID=531938 RepID=A0A316HKU6_9PSEU|nr:hypothetical protein [Lentzea atacamensis]PWK80803.1 hypothetical protein C8D88_12281 [Lentzea atacamensis]